MLRTHFPMSRTLVKIDLVLASYNFFQTIAVAITTRNLGYSDDQAYRRLKAAKLLQDVPEVADQLKSGEINLTQ